MSRQHCLRQLQVKQKGLIIAVNAKGELGRRIRDMGLVPGTEVKVVGRAPLKDPVALRLKDFTLTLRNNEADYITVEIDGE
jgi:ferrous iron transport protein A